MNDSFDTVIGQPKVREFLRAIVAGNKVSHAYLFCGPAGSNKGLAARALAQALLCENPQFGLGKRGGCGACGSCGRIAREKHPDVRVYNPEGANGYLVSQIREISSEASLSPIQSKNKVYILNRVDLLGTQAANAFLKTLEEPPQDVVIILLARSLDNVLPTIVSRCQVVPFRNIPPSEACAIVSQNTGTSEQVSRQALAACNGSLSAAVAFLKSNERLQFRQEVLNIMHLLRQSDDWDLLKYAKQLLKLVDAPLDEVRAQQESELAANADFLEKSVLRQIEARNKRALSAKSNESIFQLNAIIRCWLRDLMVVLAGSDGLVVNDDKLSDLYEAAQFSALNRISNALVAVDACERAISYNVSPETCIDVLLIQLRDSLFGTATPQTPQLT